MLETVLAALGGLLLIFFGVLIITAGRQSIEQTLLVKLTDGGLSFHARLHTPRDALTPFDENALILYISTSNISLPTFVVTKFLSLCSIGSGAILVGRALPGLADHLDFADVLMLLVARAGLALAFLFLALVFFRKRRDVAKALCVLRAKPLAGLTDSAMNELEDAISRGDPLATGLTEIVQRAVVAAVPVRAWAILVPIFAVATAAELLLSLVFH